VIPLRLKLSGFLSYRDPVELDFTHFDLACISGSNGAGKSSLLDAMTWALFGQARRHDESVINTQLSGKAAVAEVSLVFTYEGGTYRVQRRLPQGKTMSLEFNILQNAGKKTEEWKPLTERTLRDTQARIEEILRLDYDTFINVSFFLQGRADQFAQQVPSKRKDILGKILGLEDWETYKERAAGRRKLLERDLDGVDGRLQEIEAELAEEAERKARLAELETQLAGLVESRKAEEAALANVKQVRASLESQRELVRKLGDVLARSRTGMAGLQTRLADREAERLTFASLLARSDEVETAYRAWQAARADLEKWDLAAGQFHEHDQRRQPLLREIEMERARLEEENRRLEQDRQALDTQQEAARDLQAELANALASLAGAEGRLRQRTEVEAGVQASRERQAELRAENESLRIEMDQVKLRLDSLAAAEGAACPLCGQPLSPEHRRSTLAQIRADGKQMGDRFRANKSAQEELAAGVRDGEQQLTSLGAAEKERLAAAATVSQLRERLEAFQRAEAAWKKGGAKRQAALGKLLAANKYALEARKQLVKIDKELAALGYDAAAHDAARKAEVAARPAEADSRALESARAALKPLDDEIANLHTQIKSQQAELLKQEAETEAARLVLAAVEAHMPDLVAAERAFFDLQERENRLNQEVGGARQKVSVLDDLRSRRKALDASRDELGLEIGRYRTLERAFGKDGVPALLIEQALPEIELKANEILGRLSDDSMRIRFETQARYKDDKRKDLRETLEIRVSDGAGEREYELFSGGEAFRVNFAIRLALSEVLAQRKGARLQLLVIDEGFGSQDALGRQRLIQAINAVRGDFAKILVITHLEELKDVFPTRIEVEKTERGSTVVVM
jgi:exonuclease SbcC